MTAKVATPVADVTPEPVAAAKLPRVKSCAGLAEFGLGEAGCKRLPRHKGEHRVTLHRPAVAKVATLAGSPSRAKAAKARVTRKVARSGEAGKALRAELAAAVESGAMTPSEALAKFASRIR